MHLLHNKISRIGPAVYRLSRINLKILFSVTIYFISNILIPLNFLKKVQLPLTIQRNVLINLKVWKLHKSSSQSVSFKKDTSFLNLPKFKWFCARTCLLRLFFSKAKSFYECLLFGCILEQNLITQVIHNQHVNQYSYN